VIRCLLATLAICLTLSGCAVGRVSPDGLLEGYAFGEGAKLEWCKPVGETGLIIKTPTSECTSIEGGNIVSGVFDVLTGVGGAAIKAAWAYLTMGVF